MVIVGLGESSNLGELSKGDNRWSLLASDVVVNVSTVDCAAVLFTVALDIFDDRADSGQVEVAWDERD